MDFRERERDSGAGKMSGRTGDGKQLFSGTHRQATIHSRTQQSLQRKPLANARFPFCEATENNETNEFSVALYERS